MTIKKNPYFKDNVFAGQFNTVRDSRWRDKELEPGECEDDNGVVLYKRNPKPVTAVASTANQLRLCDDFDSFGANGMLSKPKKESFGYNFDGKTHSADVDDTIGTSPINSPHSRGARIYVAGEDVSDPYNPNSGFGGMDSKDVPVGNSDTPNKEYVDGKIAQVLAAMELVSPSRLCKMIAVEGLDYTVGSPVKIYIEDEIVVAEPIGSNSNSTQVGGLINEIVDEETISVLTAGFIEQEDWSSATGSVDLVPVNRYYVGDVVGKLSLNQPTTGFSCCVGHAIDFKTLLVRIEPQIYL